MIHTQRTNNTERRERPLERYVVEQRKCKNVMSSSPNQNINQTERFVSVASGGILALLGLARRDAVGLAIAAIGGALGYRGVTGHCHAYQALGINTANETNRNHDQQLTEPNGVNVEVAFLINKSPESLYEFWRNFENLPKFMSHLETVKIIDDKRSHWVAKAPTIYGGQVEWDAEITTDIPSSQICWRTSSGADIEHVGSIRFEAAPGDRGTHVYVRINYQPPAGKVGRLLAYLFREDPEQQIRDDLRKFKRIMEVGEVPCTDGQPRGTCGASKQ
jgi:uncharacterized membrane protein